MTATALKLRSPHFESIKVTAPTAGYTAGQLILESGVVGVIVETVTLGQEVALITKCEKIILPKTTAEAWVIGQKLYLDTGTGKLTTASTGNTLCGRANVAAAASDTEGEVNLNGGVAA